MKLSQILRISVALAIIFAAGIFTGRWTAPRPPVVMSAPGGRTITSDMILARLTSEISLDAAQKAKAKVIIDEVSEQMTVVPAASPQRRDLFRQIVPRLKALLRPDQHAAFDRYVDLTEKKWARMIRRRDAMQGNSDLPPPSPERRQ